MTKKIKVVIGGKEYSLAGVNEKLILDSAAEVNKQLESLVQFNSELPDKSVSHILAALNIAEKEIVSRENYENEINYISTELSKMSDFLTGITRT